MFRLGNNKSEDPQNGNCVVCGCPLFPYEDTVCNLCEEDYNEEEEEDSE